MWKWKNKHTIPLKIGLAKDMKKCIKNNKKRMSSQKKYCFFMSQKIFKIYFKFFIKKTLVGEGFG
jgi:hypothetical protein